MSDVEHLFMCLLAIWMSSLEKVSVHVFCLFLHWIICFLGVEFDQFFIDFGYYPVSDMSFANIFSHSVSCLLVLLIVSLAVQKFYFDEVPIVHFCFCFPSLGRRVSCCGQGQRGCCLLSSLDFDGFLSYV